MIKRKYLWISMGFSVFGAVAAILLATHVRISYTKSVSLVRAPDFSWVDLVDHGDIQSVRQRISNSPLEARRYRFFGTPLLHYAVGTDRLDVVSALLENGADVNAVVEAGPGWGGHGTTALEAAVAGKNIEMVKLLVKYGANLDARDPDGSTLIDIAGRLQDGPMIDLLRHLKSSER